MLYYSRLVGGCLIHVLLVWINVSNFFKLSPLCVTFKLIVKDSNRQMPCGKPKVVPPYLVVAVASELWPGILFLQSGPVFPPAPWLQQYVILHQVGWWYFFSLFRFGSGILLSLLALPAPP